MTIVKFPGWKVLIVDEHSMRVISSAIGMYDIMERKITLVESLEKKRAPFPDMGGIYMLNPTATSVAKLLDDFAGNKSLYGNGIFLYFLGRLPDNLLDQIKTCKPLMKRLQALTEINVDFLAKEERCFSLDMRDAFAAFYLRKGSSPIELSIADKLVTVCATLNEYPHIRFKQASGICTSLANVFHLKMDEFVSQNPSWWYHGGPKKKQTAQRERGILLLLDRADDCLTPLMHDFNYQSLVHDLLPMEGDRITYQSETATDTSKTEAKDVLLDERDPLWVELRGKHIAQVIETLSERIREIMSSSTGSSLGKKNGGGGNMSLSQMATALKALPEYKEIMSKLSQHMHISHECMDVFKKDGLMDLSDLEQTLATGKDEDGRSPKLADMIDRVEGYLMRIKDPKKRLRLILIVTISQGGMRTQDRRRLMNAAELSRSDSQILNALEILGLSTQASSEEKNRLVSMLTGYVLISTFLIYCWRVCCPFCSFIHSFIHCALLLLFNTEDGSRLEVLPMTRQSLLVVDILRPSKRSWRSWSITN
jgi:syntaxin-binding protein 1